MPIPIRLSEIGAACAAILQELASNADRFGLAVSRSGNGARILIADRDTEESAQAGAITATLCQGGLAQSEAYSGEFGGKKLVFIRTRTEHPRLATLTMQSAREFEGVMLSGPVKLHLERSDEVSYDEDPSNGTFCAIVQANAVPGDHWIAALAEKAGCSPDQLTLIVAPQERVLGAAQIAGRMNENMILTMERSLGLPGAQVSAIEGYSPICPAGAATARGALLQPDDYLHYGAFSRLTLRPDSGIDAKWLADNLAFSSLPIFGGLFIDLLDAAGGDFFQIPNLLHINKLAVVEVFDSSNGETYRAGVLRPDCLA